MKHISATTAIFLLAINLSAQIHLTNTYSEHVSINQYSIYSIAIASAPKEIRLGHELRRDSILNKHHLVLEIGGAGLFGSLNYERKIWNNSIRNKKLLYRIGLSYLPHKHNGKNVFGTPVIPFGLYYLIGIKHHLELGLNNSFAYTFVDDDLKDNDLHYYITPSIGYRYENFIKNSFFVSTAYSPMFYYDEKTRFAYWLKLGFGYSF